MLESYQTSSLTVYLKTNCDILGALSNSKGLQKLWSIQCKSDAQKSLKLDPSNK